MRKVIQGFMCGLLMVGLMLTPACRTTKKPKQEVTETTAPTPPPPVVETVAPTTDFVKETPPAPEPKVASDVLPADLDAANRMAQEKGFIQDAFFGYDESTLTGDAQTALTNSATWLKQHAEYNLLIEGHCDERGTEQYNLALGDRRANTAKDYLATLGIDASRIRTVSYGEERPFESGHDEPAWSKNRRAHLVLVGK